MAVMSTQTHEIAHLGNPRHYTVADFEEMAARIKSEAWFVSNDPNNFRGKLLAALRIAVAVTAVAEEVHNALVERKPRAPVPQE